MQLNLGLENLNGMSRTDSALDLVGLYIYADQIDSFCDSVESYMAALENKEAIQQAIKKYGVTQSMVALVGAENLNVISMEADDDTKKSLWKRFIDWLKKIWNKFMTAITYLFNKPESIIKKLKQHADICEKADKVKVTCDVALQDAHAFDQGKYLRKIQTQGG